MPGLRGRSRSVRSKPAGSRPSSGMGSLIRRMGRTSLAPSLRGGVSRARRYATPSRSPSRAPSLASSFGSRGSSLTSSGVGISGSQISRSHAASKLGRFEKRAGQPMIWSQNVGYRVDGPSGFTRHDCTPVLLNNLHLQSMWQQVLAQTGDSTVPGAGIGGTKFRPPQKFFVETVEAHLMFTNSCLAQCEVDIFEMLAIRDVPTQMTYYGNVNATATYYNILTDPANMWAQGSEIQSGQVGAVGVGAPSTFFGAKPTDVELIKQYFKIVSKKTVVMSPGATHRHTVKMRVNRLIDSANLQLNFSNPAANSAQPNNWKGLTRYFMVVQRGLPVSSKGESPIVTTADTHIDYVWDYRYKFTYVTNNALLTNNQDNLQSLADEPNVLTTFNSSIQVNAFT